MRPLPAEPMTADAFIDWAMRQPSGRFELVAGEVVAMAPERAGHALVKLAVAGGLKRAVAARGLACEAYPDGMSVVVDEATVYEPDALVRCGDPLDRDAVTVADPLVIVEVLSPGTRAVDLGGKLDGYFRLASVRHYLIVKVATRSVIHHWRADDGGLRTALVASDASLHLDPPGPTVEVAEFFADL